jgi:hypothetical protein
MSYRRIAKGIVSIAFLAPFVFAGFALAACGVNWFPKCDDPSKPNGGCPPVEPDYPRAARDGGTDASRD